MKIRKIVLLCSLFAALLFVASCDLVSDKKTDDENVGSQADTIVKNKLEEVYYTHLSPSEIISYFENEGFNFKSTLLNPLSNSDKYISKCDKVLNIGVYSADLAYQILCKKSSEATTTFKVIKKMCNEANIQSAFDDQVKQRVINNINNNDSLTEISNDIYIKTVNDLRESGAHNLYVILSAGSFVETMFLIVSSVKNSDQEEKTMKKIIEQKLVFDDLYSMLQFLNTDENISLVINDITELRNAFNQISIKSENVKINKSNSGELVLSGNNKINYSKESFDILKSAIIKLRTKWTVK